MNKKMIRTIPLAFAAMCALGLSACTEKKSESETASTGDAYPLKTCVISGEELGGMGDPVVMEHNGTTVKLCCKNCIEDFKADPDKYVAMVKAAQ